jgi:hypothetical protein
MRLASCVVSPLGLLLFFIAIYTMPIIPKKITTTKKESIASREHSEDMVMVTNL